MLHGRLSWLLSIFEYLHIILYEPSQRYVPKRLDRHKVTPVKSIYLLNVVVEQKSLIKTQKTKQATYCPDPCNRGPLITRHCV